MHYFPQASQRTKEKESKGPLVIMGPNKQRKTGRAIKTYAFIIASDSASRKLKNLKVISRAPLSDLMIFRLR